MSLNMVWTFSYRNCFSPLLSGIDLLSCHLVVIHPPSLQIDMVEQLWKCMKMFVEDVSMPVMYPEEKVLFEVREDE